MKVCMFVLNNCKRDARVLKEAKTLTDAGHDVRIIAILDEYTEPYEERNGFRIIRVVRNSLYSRFLQAILKVESFAIEWIYHRPKRIFTPSSYQVEQPSTSASTEDLPLSERAYYRVRRGLFRVLRTTIRPFNRLVYLVDYYRRSWQIVKDEPADIYHSHDLTTLPVGYMAMRRTDGKLVYDSHELFTELNYIPRIERWIFRWLERRLIHRADAVIIPNEFAAKELSRRYGISLPSVVRNCPPLATHGDELHNNSLRRSLGLDDTVPIIIHIGIFSRSRGSEKLVSAVPFLNGGIVVFLGWGAGTEEGDLKELVKLKGLEGRVLFAPPVAPDDVVGYISSAQVGVVLFRNVSLNHYYVAPNKLWESMNAGLPVVSSNFPVLEAIVEGYHFGKTCNPEAPEDIAAAINWVLSDKKRYDRMRRNALKAAKIFNWENESKELLKIYSRLIKQTDVRTEG